MRTWSAHDNELRYWSATTSDMGWLAHPVGSEVLSLHQVVKM